AVALPLEIPLRPGTDPEKELAGLTVPDDVEAALLQTVRTLSGKVRATAAGSQDVGTTDWIVVDGHRRWNLTVQKKVLRASAANRPDLLLETEGLDLTALLRALDQQQVPDDAKPVFAALFAPNQTTPPDFANYKVTITPL